MQVYVVMDRQKAGLDFGLVQAVYVDFPDASQHSERDPLMYVVPLELRLGVDVPEKVEDIAAVLVAGGGSRHAIAAALQAERDRRIVIARSAVAP